jgi:hypothetical protein
MEFGSRKLGKPSVPSWCGVRGLRGVPMLWSFQRAGWRFSGSSRQLALSCQDRGQDREAYNRALELDFLDLHVNV